MDQHETDFCQKWTIQNVKTDDIGECLATQAWSDREQFDSNESAYAYNIGVILDNCNLSDVPRIISDFADEWNRLADQRNVELSETMASGLWVVDDYAKLVNTVRVQQCQQHNVW